MAILEVRNITRSFGGLAAVQAASLELHAGELIGLIGPNGAGKTTLFNLISGVYKPDSGDIVFRGESIVGVPPHRIAFRGITRTFQNIRLFAGMTVLDNVKAAQHHRTRSGLLASMVRTRSFEREEAQIERDAMALLDAVGLADRRDALPGALPYGAQRRLEIARALAGGPQVLLLDEPAAGMNRAETAELTDLILRLQRERELSILLIEHQMAVVMGICRRIYVLDFGEVIAHGTPAEIQNDPEVIEAYLGKGVHLVNALLSVENLTVHYGAIRALKGISFQVAAAEVVALIGANGAGKSTTLRTISGLMRPSGGSVRLEGREIGGWPAHEIVRAGIAHVPEGRGIFTNLSVRENLELAGYVRRRDRAALEKARERVFRLFPRLKERLNQPGATLSGGEQQMLAFARALMTGGKLLLMDEPSMGLAPVLVENIFEVIREVKAEGATILLVEQNAYQALGVADRAYVLETGQIVLEGLAEKLRDSPEVKRAYLGG